MTTLGRDAAAQAAKDANAKLQEARRRGLAPIAWFFSQRLKVQFIVVAVALFLGYAAVAAVLEFAGLRPGHTRIIPSFDCEAAGLSLEERVSCKEARRDDRDRRYALEGTRLREQMKQREMEEQAEEKERKRQRGLVLKREFDNRIVALAAGQYVVANKEAEWWLERELSVELFNILKVSDHPLNTLKINFTKKDIDQSRGHKGVCESRPGYWEEGQRIQRLCLVPEPAPNCATEFTDAVMRMNFCTSMNVIGRLAGLARIADTPNAPPR